MDLRRVQPVLPKGLAGAAVHYLAAVVGQNVAAQPGQAQRPGHRLNAHQRAAAGQNDLAALKHGPPQGGPGGGGDFFSGIGECAVQIQRKGLVAHKGVPHFFGLGG